MDISDKRLSKTTELFMGIKLLKLLGWDLPFAENIKRYRNIELEYLRKDAVFVAINSKQTLCIILKKLDFILIILCSIHHSRIGHSGHHDHLQPVPVH